MTRKVTVVGAGPVGLCQAIALAEAGNIVLVVEIMKEKVESLLKGQAPIFEPGLNEAIQHNMKEQRLDFTTDISTGIKHGSEIFACVPAPSDKNFGIDLKYLRAVASDIAKIMEGPKIMATKSTVPPGTGKEMLDIMRTILSTRGLDENLINIASNPEFLAQGTAVIDALNPEKIVLGSDNENTSTIFREIYNFYIKRGVPYEDMSVESAEITKYACNHMLALRVSFMNERANLCDKYPGANIKEVQHAMGLDDRIGSKFLDPGAGFGGRCFPDNLVGIQYIYKKVGMESKMAQVTEEINNKQWEVLTDRLLEKLDEVGGKQIAILGATFKPNTDDMGNSPMFDIVGKLLVSGYNVKVFDPTKKEKIEEAFDNQGLQIFKSSKLQIVDNEYEAITRADALFLVTPWNIFKDIDLREMGDIMMGNVIMDGRNMWNRKEMEKHGFDYMGVGT